jgi:hypothetical protein
MYQLKLLSTDSLPATVNENDTDMMQQLKFILKIHIKQYKCRLTTDKFTVTYSSVQSSFSSHACTVLPFQAQTALLVNE